MKKAFLVLAISLAGFSASSQLYALTIKLASPFPEGSEWDNTLKAMGASWMKITEGRVKVRTYPSGIAGDEENVIRKMRIGQIDATILSNFGLKNLVPDTFVITLPGYIRNEKELDATIAAFPEIFDEAFLKEGFRVLALSKSGWARFFTNKRITTPGEMRRINMSVSSSEPDIAANFKSLGFRVVPNSINEIITALQSGMVDSFYAPPLAAAAFQWFALAPYMLDFAISPAIGGIVISDRAWRKIPKRYHEELKVATRELGNAFYEQSVKVNEESMRVMKKNGLKVVSLSEKERDEWIKVFKGGWKLMLGDGKIISLDSYQKVSEILRQTR